MKFKYQESVLPEEILLLMMLQRDKISCAAALKQACCELNITKILQRCQDAAQTLQEMK